MMQSNLTVKINIFVISIACIVIWLVSFFYFLLQVYSCHQPVSPKPMEAIVVLTGGAKRIETGTNLLKQKLGRQLFISGVSNKISAAEFHKIIMTDKDINLKNVILDTQSTSTRENVCNTAAWLRAHNIKSVYLVTEQFHMPRSLLQFHQKLSQLKIISFKIIPWPVHCYDIFEKSNKDNTKILQCILREYLKFYSALIIFKLENLLTVHV